MTAKYDAASKYEEAVSALWAARLEGTNALLQKAIAAGETENVGYWTVVYDMEHAPTTTNRAQLLILGITVMPPSEVEAEGLERTIRDIAVGLEKWGTYIKGDSHLTDGEVYERIYRAIDDSVPATAPGMGYYDIVDFTEFAGEFEANLVMERGLPQPQYT